MMFPSLFCVLYSMSWVIWNWCELQLSRLGSVPRGKCLRLGDGWVDPRGCVATTHLSQVAWWTTCLYGPSALYYFSQRERSKKFPPAASHVIRKHKVCTAGHVAGMEGAWKELYLWPWHSGRVPSWSPACRAPHRVLWRLWWYRGAAYMMKTYYWTCNMSPTKKSVCCLDVLHQQTLSHHIFSSKLVIYF